MPTVSLRYRFSVRLPAAADAAYRWATDYQPDDPARMGEDGVRRIRWLAGDAVILTDTVRSGRRSVTKSRLVRLRPRERAWTSTHLSGPFRHSQFLYEILPAGRRASRLRFTGLHLERVPRRLAPRAATARARALARDDAQGWRRLVRAMARDLGPGPRP